MVAFWVSLVGVRGVVGVVSQGGLVGSVLGFREDVLGSKTIVLAKTSRKCSFSFQFGLRSMFSSQVEFKLVSENDP